MTGTRRIAVVVACLLALTGCTFKTARGESAVAEQRTLTVFFASASTRSMDAAGERMTDVVTYVSNRVVVATHVAPGTNGGILTDGGGAAALDAAKTWIQCAHEAPCGAAADKATAALGVKSQPVSLEPDVKSVMAKLLAGEADAGIVYLTDAMAAGKAVNTVEFGTFVIGSEQAKAISTQYMIGQVDTGNADAAAFVQFVTSSAGYRAAAKKGFDVPL